MSLNHLPGGRPGVADPKDAVSPWGHPHFWQRALSRRQFVRVAGGTAATGLALGSTVLGPGLSRAWAGTSTLPLPIKGGIQPFGPNTEVFHLFLPGQGNEPSTIRDFNGLVGLANVAGTGTGTKKKSGESKELAFDVDCRFMQGKYVGRDRLVHTGTFGFV
jgi:hypothetical protein